MGILDRARFGSSAPSEAAAGDKDGEISSPSCESSTKARWLPLYAVPNWNAGAVSHEFRGKGPARKRPGVPAWCCTGGARRWSAPELDA